MTDSKQDTPADDSVWAASTFELGPHDALVGPTTFGLVEAGHASTRDQLWILIAAETPLDDVLDELGSAD